MRMLSRFAFVLAAILVAAAPGYCDRLRGLISMEYGTTTSTFGLDGGSYFYLPPQLNGAADFVLTGGLEYLALRRWPIEIGLGAKGSFAFSSWDLGAPPGGVYDSSTGAYDLGDGLHISADWWALQAMATAHVHLGPMVTLDGSIGYGPWGYPSVNYWDDYGLVTGPVYGLFPQNAWGLDWSAGLSFGLFPMLALQLEVGNTGPDFVAGLGVGFSL